MYKEKETQAQKVVTLSRLCGLIPTVPLGLTDACRLVVRGAGVAVTPTDVRQLLQSIGFDLTKYANDFAAIHTIQAAQRIGQAPTPGTTAPTRSCSAPTLPPSCAKPSSRRRALGVI